jgi:hypothetical protein
MPLHYISSSDLCKNQALTKYGLVIKNADESENLSSMAMIRYGVETVAVLTLAPQRPVN